MKSTGIVREIDELGRVVLPVELRRMLEMNEGDPLEFFCDQEAKIIMIRSYRTEACLFCQNTEQLHYFKHRFICESCIEAVPARSLPPEAQNMENDEAVRLDDPYVLSRETTNTKHAHNRQTARSMANQDHSRSAQKSASAKRRDTLQKLLEALNEQPHATQKQLAELIGISQGRVSQLMRQAQQHEAHYPGSSI